MVKLYTNRPYNMEAFKLTVKKICRPTNAVCFTKLGSGIMMTIFGKSKTKKGC